MSEERPVCRRCKKKRPIDEPLDTARYRTCKPCREIERKKKRLKKIESQGKNPNIVNNQVHQGHVQNQETIDIPKSDYQDESILNIASQVHRHLPPHIQQYDQQIPPVLAPIQQQSKKHDDREIPIDELLLKEGAAVAALAGEASASNSAAVAAAAVAAAAGGDDNARTIQLPRPSRNLTEEQQQLAKGAVEQLARQASGEIGDKNDETNLFAAIRNAEAAVGNIETTSHQNNELRDDNLCLYCGATRDIEDNGRYNLCENCVDNPTDTANVFNDFSAFLNKVELGQISDLDNVIYISKVDNGSIPDFKQNGDGSSNLDQITNELLNRYINRVILKSGFKFSRTSSNLSVRPPPKSIKLLFKCKQDIKTIQKNSQNNGSSNPAISNSRRLKTEDCRSNVYISYDIFGKSLSIKFNHKAHKPFLEKIYSPTLIDKVKQLEGSIHDLNDVFNYIRDNAFLNSIEDDGLKLEIGLLKKQNFVKDFSNF